MNWCPRGTYALGGGKCLPSPRKRLRPGLLCRARAAAGMGGACGLGASPASDLRESARAVPTYAQIPPGCTPRLQWGSVVAWSSIAATAGFVRGHRAPVTTNNRRAHRDTDHRCTRMCKRPNLLPVSRSSQSRPLKLQLRTWQLTGPAVATPPPLRRDLSFATGVDLK
jgi:hypothetical protein